MWLRKGSMFQWTGVERPGRVLRYEPGGVSLCRADPEFEKPNR